MKKKIIIALFAVFALFLGLLILPELLSNEPKYQGKRLTRWFKQYYQSGQDSAGAFAGKRVEAYEALQALGTNAVPFLLDELFSTRKDNALITNVQNFLFLIQLPGPLGAPVVDADTIREEAAQAIIDINPPGDFIVPLVTNQLHGTNAAHCRAALYVLSKLRVGEREILPILQAQVVGTNWNDQVLAIWDLVNLGPAARPALPQLVEIIENENRYGALFNITHKVLAEIGADAKVALPALRARYDRETNADVRVSLATTLCKIDAGQTNALDDLLRYATTPGDPHRNNALYRLSKIGPNASRVAPTLAELAKHEDMNTWSPAIEALANSGHTNQAVTILTEKLSAPDAQKRFSAAYVILNYQPTNALAIEVLIKSLGYDSFAFNAINRLATLRPIPESGVATLRAIAMDKNNKFQKQAEKALKKIKPEQLESPSRK